ncbi:Os03g0453800 [Oryza sativa Japonica Group]|uniref:Expressed protein n=2 Tax=Oryza sativa subsp. japonica TaxID=39947 RepID=Q10IH2_ORYSJ|nr:expressed protein [Oryza sativa Japonica Group]KAB8092350.1 hypothetical protein EE612_018381 [Oryza sativa]KAF2939889.1 hypothetical protein DAI22_03g229500 [Oryza sativa Japonica Group]BAF12389.1 Os03g0453800 [Oryza sativa Japonica Group]BAS84907.1 Os03g0453800 [Oryza sativa Japonica Group]|eukprot:NP_001050475.1 Os03g0453800 [Oryza sativa Japonica Group]
MTMAQVADTVALHPWLLDLLPLLIVLLISTHVLVLVHTSPSRESSRPPSGSSVLVPCPSGAPSVQGQALRELLHLERNQGKLSEYKTRMVRLKPKVPKLMFGNIDKG